MILMRTSSCLLIQVPLHKQLVDIFVRIPLTGLVNSIRTFSKSHSSYPIVLRYYNITFMANANQLIIYGICSCSDNNYFAIIRSQHMVRITQQCG